ncbi:GmrSD restriction endonuclease domain-containing protein [Parasphingorhabdus pacifica]
MTDHGLKFEIESKTVAEFRSLYNSGELVLRPEYQRKAVWPERAKVSLMETILLGYPIPEIYLSYETTPEGKQTASVVDGQQRLTALLDFLDNRYPLDDLESDRLQSKFHGNLFRELPADVRQEFFQYRFPIRRLSNLADEFVRAVFARVNRVNMVLTEQELRNALLPGPFNDFLKDCAAHHISEVSGIFSGERRNRGGDLEFYAEVFSTCIFGLSNKRTELNERYDKISTDFEDYHGKAKEFLALLGFLDATIKWSGRTRWSNIVDMFTLLHVSWDLRDTLQGASDKQAARLREVLDNFQRAVSSYKRNDEKGDADSLILPLSRLLQISGGSIEEIIDEYISGVRNSSDLGSRRTRSRQLKKIIESSFGGHIG